MTKQHDHGYLENEGFSKVYESRNIRVNKITIGRHDTGKHSNYGCKLITYLYLKPQQKYREGKLERTSGFETPKSTPSDILPHTS